MAPVKRLGVCALAFCLSIGITGVTAGVVRSPEGEALSAFATSSTEEEMTGLSGFSTEKFAYNVTQYFPTAPVTFEAWIKVPANMPNNTRGGVIFGNYCQGNTKNIDYELVENGRLKYGVNRSANSESSVDFAVTFNHDFRTGEWTHLAVVRNTANKTLSLYVNGVLEQTVADSDYNADSYSTYRVGFNRANWTTKRPFQGEIHSVAVYGDVRTAEEVAADMNAVNASDADLYGYWDLTGVQTPAPVKDLSANGADLEYIQLDTWYEADYDMTDGDYTMIVLPDTQRITKNAPEDAAAMMEWIADNADALNLKFVMHMGDFTDGGNQLSEFGIASNYMSILDEAGIPWSMVPGNHDYDDELASTDNLVNFNDAFPYSKYSRNEWFGGSFQMGSMENSYYKIEAEDGIKYLIFGLEFAPRAAVMSWVERVIAANPDYRVIVTTHYYLDNDGFRFTENSYGYAKAADYTGMTGEEMWEILRKYGNVNMVFGGHIITDDLVYRVDQGDNGNDVVQMLVNAQGVSLSKGEPLMLIIKFTNNGETMDFYYYNPLNDTYYNIQNRFSLEASVITSESSEPETGGEDVGTEPGSGNNDNTGLIVGCVVGGVVVVAAAAVGTVVAVRKKNKKKKEGGTQ